eukprot:6462073-Amphidinium_carterae.1
MKGLWQAVLCHLPLCLAFGKSQQNMAWTPRQTLIKLTLIIANLTTLKLYEYIQHGRTRTNLNTLPECVHRPC